MKNFMAWVMLLVAAWALLPPHFELLLVIWGGAVVAWIFFHLLPEPLLFVSVWALLLIAAFFLPAFLPTTWPALLRLGLIALLWSITLGIAWRVVARLQKAAG